MTPRKENPQKAGRHELFKPEYVEQAHKLCLLGATDPNLADFFHVTTTTVCNWKNSHPEFFEALRLAKLEADQQVSKSLFQRALGYSHNTQKIFNANGVPLVVDTVEQYPPDKTAAIFWLKNRQPSQWRDRVETDITSGGEKLAGYAIIPSKSE